MNLLKYIPVVGQVIDLSVWIADKARSRRALKAAIATADARRKSADVLAKRLDRIAADAKKLKK